MENKQFEYNGFIGSIEYCNIDCVYHGKIININDLVVYCGRTLEELEKNFVSSVEDYSDKMWMEIDDWPEDEYPSPEM